jgi:hypothetical protein
MSEIELAILVIVAAILAVSFMFLIAAVFMQRKAERVAAMYGHGLVTIEMQDEDFARLLMKFATVIASSDNAATYCVQLAQAMDTNKSWEQRHFIQQLKREMHTDNWFLVYDRDSAQKLAVDVLDAVKPKGRVVKSGIRKPA